jgi:hypothetical protein
VWLKVFYASGEATFLDFNSDDQKIKLTLSNTLVSKVRSGESGARGQSMRPYLVLRKGIVENVLRSRVRLHLDRWTYVAVTYSDDKKTARMYVDGVVAADAVLTVGFDSVGESVNMLGTNSSSPRGSLNVAFNDLSFYAFDMRHEQVLRDYNYYFRCGQLHGVRGRQPGLREGGSSSFIADADDSYDSLLPQRAAALGRPRLDQLENEEEEDEHII